MTALIRIQHNTESINPSPLLQSSKRTRVPTGELSNSTKSSNLNSTATFGFYDQKSKKKDHTKDSSLQQMFVEGKGCGIENEANSLSNSQVKQNWNKDEFYESQFEELPSTTKASDHENHTNSSVGFMFHENDIRQGVTLDKLFGGEFKKINIFDMKQDSLNDKEMFPDPEGTIDSIRCKYQSYDILETENEEDVESRQTDRKREKTKQTPTTQGSLTNTNQTTEVVDKIQKKYKRAKSKSIQRKKPSFIEDEIEGHDNDNDNSFTEQYFKKDYLDQNNLGSKSMSPKFEQERKKGKYHIVRIKRSKFNQTDHGHESLQNSQVLNNSKINTNSQTQFPEKKKNKMLISSITFGNKEDSGIDMSRVIVVKAKKLQTKKPLGSVNSVLLGEFEDLGQPKHDLPPMTFNKTSKAININNFHLMNTMAAQTVKAEEAKSFKKRLLREKQIMTEKIKMNEKEKLERYSKMFKLSNQESKKVFVYHCFNKLIGMSLMEIENNRLARTQRHSTQQKDDKLFERKKLMNF